MRNSKSIEKFDPASSSHTLVIWCTMAAETPPMGWRSWNLFGRNVNQTLIEAIMRGVAMNKRLDRYSGQNVSLCDLGYCDVGLDDNWQACGSPSAAPGMHYHDSTGNSIIDKSVFPDLKSMVTLAHELNLTAGWYHNNCICRDHCQDNDVCGMQIRQDARATAAFGFDGVKLDGCGGQVNLSQWQYYLNLYSSRKTIIIENCHWGKGPPPTRDVGGCPYHFYRTSNDIFPEYKSMVDNLLSIEKYHRQNLSFPGCWAYPDMLQVGVHFQDHSGLTPTETRSHFGAWAIVSSPLVLSHDVNDDTITEQIWNLISNREVLEVNQVYAGDSGGVYWQSEETINLGAWDYWGEHERHDVVAPVTQLLAKPLTKGRVAVLALNHGRNRQSLTVYFKTVPGVTCDSCRVRDIWARQTIGIFSRAITLDVESHDSAFIVIAPSFSMDKRILGPNLFFAPTIFLLCLGMLWILLRTRLQHWKTQFNLRWVA